MLMAFYLILAHIIALFLLLKNTTILSHLPEAFFNKHKFLILYKFKKKNFFRFFLFLIFNIAIINLFLQLSLNKFLQIIRLSILLVKPENLKEILKMNVNLTVYLIKLIHPNSAS
jgi:hypothetical protein